MLRLSFRTKLLLAMMFVVAGVTVVALLITQQRVQANYERLYRNQYERQLSYFTMLQEARLGAIKEQCLRLVQSMRLIALMNEDPIDTMQLHHIATNELRTVLARPVEKGPPQQRRRGQPGQLPPASFYVFLKADGNAVPLPEFQAQPLPDPVKQRVNKRLGFLRDGLRSPEIQNVAYLPAAFRADGPANPRREGGKSPPPKADEGEGKDKPTLKEIIVTRIVDPQSNENLGALVLGFPLPDLVPQPRQKVVTTNRADTASAGSNRVELLQAGILIEDESEDQLFADSAHFPAPLRKAAAKEVLAQIKAGAKNQGTFSADLLGAPYRVFYEILNEGSAFPAAYQVCLFSMAEAHAEVRDLRWKVLGLGAGAIVVALALSLFLSHGLSSPIHELVAGTDEIKKGNFQTRVAVRSSDEIGQLASSFNEMAEGLAEKEKYRAALNLIADEKIARRLVNGELTLGGELREVTILFCDIRGFTTLTQHMPPREVIEMLNEHMTALMSVVKEHNGVLDKFVGDCLMVMFGAPENQGDDTSNATRCALRLIQVREQLNKTSRHQLRISVGLATGTVVAGCMGSQDQLSYTVIGERVNLASRLCARAAAREVLIDESTRRKLSEKFEVEPIGDTELKGFATPVPIMRVVGVKV